LLNTERPLNIIAKAAARSKTRVFIAGGYLRDTLLKKENISDIDLVVYGDAKKTARAFSRSVKGAFVELSDAFNIYRVSCKEGYTCDFSGGRGKSIEDDLKKRDFTVNAFAREVNGGELIDIFGGLKDLKNGIIRETAGKSTFKDDPLRLLRAVRFAAVLAFKIDSKTEKYIKAMSALLTKPAKERVRDELLKILEVKNSAEYIILLDKLGLLEKIFPVIKEMKGVSQPGFHHLDVFGHSIEALDRLEKILLESDLGLSKDIKNHIKERLAQKLGRSSRGSFLKLTALLHDSGKPKTKSKDKKGTHFYNHELLGAENFKKTGKQLKLSNEEIDLGVTVIKCHLRTGYLSGLKKISKHAVYKFFKDTGEAAVEVLLLSWADRLSAQGVKVDKKTISHHKTVIEGLFKEYYKLSTTKQTAPLINGFDIMKRFKLPPSPMIGKLLEKAKEAQATGKVRTKNEVLEYLRKYQKSSR